MEETDIDQLNYICLIKTEFLYPFSIQHTCTCKTNFLCISDFFNLMFYCNDSCR